MAKKLSEDQIKWVLSLDVSEAEEGYHKLRQENKQLEERNKEVKKSLRELEKAGKQTGEAYTRLSAELAENNKKLATNREMTKKLSLSPPFSSLTRPRFIFSTPMKTRIRFTRLPAHPSILSQTAAC